MASAVQSSRDWLRSPRTNLSAWWISQAAMLACLFILVPVRTIIWIIALICEGAPWASSVLCWPCPSTLIPYAAVCGGQRSTLRAACTKASTQIWLLQKVIKLPKPACTNNDPRSSRGVLSCPRAAILLVPRAGEMEHLPSTCLILHVIRR
jgi:hypothetical protein